MAALRTVPTPLAHTLAAAILATTLAVIDTPAMVLDTVIVYNCIIILVHTIQILMSVERELTSALKHVPTPLVPTCVGVMLATCWALTKLPALVRLLYIFSN